MMCAVRDLKSGVSVKARPKADPRIPGSIGEYDVQSID